VRPRSTPAALPFTFTTALKERSITYRLVVSPRARGWRLTIRPDSGLTVVVPRRSRIDVESLLDLKASWILRHLDRLAARPRPPDVPLQHGTLVPYLGQPVTVDVLPEPPPSADAAVELAGDRLRVREPDARRLLPVLLSWYRAQAEAVIVARVHAFNTSLGHRIGRIAFRDQKTRWGSCSAQGNLAFNWRLVMAPMTVIDYVVAHELAHLRELSHSRAFWRHVAELDPAYRTHRRWLALHGSRLMLAGEIR